LKTGQALLEKALAPLRDDLTVTIYRNPPDQAPIPRWFVLLNFEVSIAVFLFTSSLWFLYRFAGITGRWNLLVLSNSFSFHLSSTFHSQHGASGAPHLVYPSSVDLAISIRYSRNPPTVVQRGRYRQVPGLVTVRGTHLFRGQLVSYSPPYYQ
jgi:hypothetical protein